MVRGCPLGRDREVGASIVYAGIARVPGAAVCAMWKTSRSKPGWCPTRTATSWAWLLGSPPVERGQAAAGDDPRLGAPRRALDTEGLGRGGAAASNGGAERGVTRRGGAVAMSGRRHTSG